MKDLCIVAPGAGMRSSYQAGAIKALVEKFNLKKPKYVITNSGGADNFTYYVSEQYPLIEKIWEKAVVEGDFIKINNLFGKKSILDLGKLEKVVRKKFNININKFRNSKIKFFVGVTDSKTGKVKYFSNRDNVDPLKLLKASSAVPYFYKKKVKIKGKLYEDGGVADILCVKKIMELKPSNTLVILSGHPKKNFFIKLITKLANNLLFKGESKKIRKVLYDFQERYEKQFRFLKKNADNIFFLIPSEKPKAGYLDNSLKRIKKTINQGYKDTINNKKLEKFLSKIKDIK